MNELVEALLKDHEPQHSVFQIDNFIVGSAGDNWAQYKQALREIKSRHDIVEGRKKEIRHLKLVAVGLKKRKLTNQGKIKYRQVIEAHNNLVAETRRTLKELDRFAYMANKLKNEIGEITDERRQQLELKSWTAKGKKLTAIDLMSTGRISGQTYEFIFSLPKASQMDIFQTLANHQPMEICGFSHDEINKISPQKQEKLE